MIIVSLVVLTVLVYSNSLHGAFVFDDLQIVLTNPLFSHIHTIRDVFMSTTSFRQILFLTYGFNFYFGGLHPFGYHLVNLILHAINVVLVYFIIRKLAWETFITDRRTEYAAFLGAAVFAVHALQSSAVSYVAGRSSILCATFYFASILCFLKARWWWILSAAFAVLAWETKQEAIALPVFVAGLVIIWKERLNWKILGALAAIPLLCVVVLRAQLQSIFSTAVANTSLMAAGFDSVMAPGLYFRSYVTAISGYYLPRMLMPLALSADPYIRQVAHWYSPAFIISTIVLMVLAGIAIRNRQKDPLVSTGIAALLLSPMAAYAVVPLADPVFEYRAYIPMLGVALLAARFLPHLDKKVLACILLALSFGTIVRNHTWSTNISVWEDAVVKNPDKVRPHFNLGTAYQEIGLPLAAIPEYHRALELKPDLWAAYVNLASLQVDAGQTDSGEATLLKVTTLAPQYTEGFINLGVLYLRRDQPYKAIEVLDRALKINPDHFSAHFNKAEALMQMKNYDAAIEEYKTSSFLRPEIGRTQVALAFAYSKAGETEEYAKQIQVLRKLGILK